MIRTVEIKLYPTPAQAETLGVWMGSCCWVYNRALEQRIKSYKRRGTTETKVFGQLSVDTTETTLNLASGYGKISGAPDEEIFVRVKDAATLADAAGNFVRVIGILE